MLNNMQSYFLYWESDFREHTEQDEKEMQEFFKQKLKKEV